MQKCSGRSLQALSIQLSAGLGDLEALMKDLFKAEC